MMSNREQTMASPSAAVTSAPRHPLDTMQGAFEESMYETMEELAGRSPRNPYFGADAHTRRRMLLEEREYTRTVSGRWIQRQGERYHPLWKQVSQISFGLHLLQESLANSDDEVIRILQTHVDEIDGFLERTTEDLDLAYKDINERIGYLKLPLDHGDVFDNMLDDRGFRTAIVEGNEKIEHICKRTTIALDDTMKDIQKGLDSTRELAHFLRNLDQKWLNKSEEHTAVYSAMYGNTEGWTGALKMLRKKGKMLDESLKQLSHIISEIQRRAGIASRRNLPNQSRTTHSLETGSTTSTRKASTARNVRSETRKSSIADDRKTANPRASEYMSVYGDLPQIGTTSTTRRVSIVEPAQTNRPRTKSLSEHEKQPDKNKSSWHRRLSSLRNFRHSSISSISEAPSLKDEPPVPTPPSALASTVLELPARRSMLGDPSASTPYDLEHILRVTPSDSAFTPKSNGFRGTAKLVDVVASASAQYPPKELEDKSVSRDNTSKHNQRDRSLSQARSITLLTTDKPTVRDIVRRSPSTRSVTNSPKVMPSPRRAYSMSWSPISPLTQPNETSPRTNSRPSTSQGFSSVSPSAYSPDMKSLISPDAYPPIAQYLHPSPGSRFPPGKSAFDPIDTILPPSSKQTPVIPEVVLESHEPNTSLPRTPNVPLEELTSATVTGPLPIDPFSYFSTPDAASPIDNVDPVTHNKKRFNTNNKLTINPPTVNVKPGKLSPFPNQKLYPSRQAEQNQSRLTTDWVSPKDEQKSPVWRKALSLRMPGRKRSVAGRS